MNFKLIFLLIVFANGMENNFIPGPTEYFDEMLIVDEPDRFILYWKHNQTDIIFELHVKTLGWIEFGFSHAGLNQYSDVIVAWLNSDNTGHFSDRHIIDKIPIIDKVQNWFPVLFQRRENFLILKFTRKLTICESTPQEEIDIDILPNNNYIIYSYGDLFVKGDNNNKDINLSKTTKGTLTIDLIGMSDNLNLFEVFNEIFCFFETLFNFF